MPLIPSSPTHGAPMGCGVATLGLLVVLLAMAAFAAGIWWLFRDAARLGYLQ